MCSERVYPNRLKLVEVGQSNTTTKLLLKTRIVFSLKILSKWKLMNDFFCKILLVLVHLEKINCIFLENYLYFKDSPLPQENHIGC